MITIKDVALVGAGICVAVAAVAIYVANPATIQAPQQNPTSTKAPQQLKQPTWDQERELATMYCAGSVRRLAQSREPYRSKSMDVEVEDTSIKWDSVSTKALAEIPSILLRGDLDRCVELESRLYLFREVVMRQELKDGKVTWSYLAFRKDADFEAVQRANYTPPERIKVHRDKARTTSEQLVDIKLLSSPECKTAAETNDLALAGKTKDGMVVSAEIDGHGRSYLTPIGLVCWERLSVSSRASGKFKVEAPKER